MAKVEIPRCLQKMIDQSNSSPRLSSFIQIDAFQYREKIFYLIASSCCDRFNPLLDGECRTICSPSGGFIGQGDGKCSDFNEKATKLENIWTLPRI